MRQRQWRAGLALVMLMSASAATAGPIAVDCIRDTSNDPAHIRALFDAVDRMARRDLEGQFYRADRGFVPADEFALLINFHHGREDAEPLRVTRIRRLEFDGQPLREAAYLVGTMRSAWFDFGASSASGFAPISDTWLVKFQGCSIHTVREVPELHYLLEGEGEGFTEP